jgi:hypothetical protein
MTFPLRLEDHPSGVELRRLISAVMPILSTLAMGNMLARMTASED